MKKLFSRASLVLLATVSLTSCRIPGWNEEEQMPKQEESNQETTRKPSNNLIYLHDQIKRYNNSAQEAFESITKSGIVVVDFYADWCGPCRKLGSTLEQVAPQLSNVTFLKVNTDKFSDLSASFNIRGIPALIFYKDGKQITRTTGSKSAKELRTIISSL